MSQEKFWVLLSKKLAGEASGPELKELEDLITEHPEWQYAIQNLQDLWRHETQKDTMQEEDASMLHLHRMTEQNIPFGDGPADEVPAIPTRRARWYWPAAVLVLAGAGFFLFRPANKGSNEQELAVKEHNEVSTRPGSKS